MAEVCNALNPSDDNSGPGIKTSAMTYKSQKLRILTKNLLKNFELTDEYNMLFSW